MNFLNKFCICLIVLICNRLVYAQIPQTQTRHHRLDNRTSAYNGLARSDGYERLFDKISNIENFNKQELRRFDDLENKINRFETKNNERLDAVLEEVKNLDWVVRKSDGNLDQLKTDVDTISRSLDSQQPRQIPSQSVSSSESHKSLSEKLDALATTLAHIASNVTNLKQISSLIQQRQRGQPSKLYLKNILKSSRNSPSQNSSSQTPISCAHLFTYSKSGVHKIGGGGLMSQPFYVWCDMEAQDGGGGWTVIQYRYDGSINFNRNWLAYKNGFGNIAGEFFIGLDKLHFITNHMLHELLIVMQDFNNTVRYAKYNKFGIGGEKEYYALNLLGKYEGTAGDSLKYSESHKFSTFDNDNDGWMEKNCALVRTGAWWYNDGCEMANLNGKYFSGNVNPINKIVQEIYWNNFHGPNYSLKSVKMLIRPVDPIFNPDL